MSLSEGHCSAEKGEAAEERNKSLTLFSGSYAEYAADCHESGALSFYYDRSIG